MNHKINGIFPILILIASLVAGKSEIIERLKNCKCCGIYQGEISAPPTL